MGRFMKIRTNRKRLVPLAFRLAAVDEAPKVDFIIPTPEGELVTIFLPRLDYISQAVRDECDEEIENRQRKVYAKKQKLQAAGTPAVGLGKDVKDVLQSDYMEALIARLAPDLAPLIAGLAQGQKDSMWVHWESLSKGALGKVVTSAAG